MKRYTIYFFILNSKDNPKNFILKKIVLDFLRLYFIKITTKIPKFRINKNSINIHSFIILPPKIDLMANPC